MPLKIVKVKDGYKVTDGKRFFSKDGLTKDKAMKQKTAILIHEHTLKFI